MTTGFIESGSRSLAALYFVPESISHVVIICHGFRGTKENAGRISAFASRINKLGLAVVAFDFSGSGESKGHFKDMTLSTQAQDLALVIEHVKTSFGCPIILLGRSFGGSTILTGGSDPRIDAFIFWSTPFLLEKAFRGMLGEEYDHMLAGQSLSLKDDGGDFMIGAGFVQDLGTHSFTDYARMIGSRPALIIHGNEDDLVEPENASLLHQNLVNSQLILVPGADHKFVDKWLMREQLTLDWIENRILKRGEQE